MASFARSLLVVFIAFTSLPGIASAAETPTFTAQLAIRGGHLVIDRDPKLTVVIMTGPLHTGCPSLTPTKVRGELIEYLDRLLREHGPVLAQRLNTPEDLAALLASDPEAVELATGNFTWDVMEKRILKWTKANQKWARHEGLRTVYKRVVDDKRLADGPLVLRVTDISDPATVQDWVRPGRIHFALAAPITSDYTKVVLDSNRELWSGIRERLASGILEDLECQLWYRDKIVDRFSDYLEMRGIPVGDFRRRKDVERSVPTVDIKARPRDRVGIAPEKPRLQPDGQATSDRVIMSPDPVLRGVLIDVPPRDLPTIRRILYLLLPTTDYWRVARRIAVDPARHLCIFSESSSEDGKPTGGFVYLGAEFVPAGADPGDAIRFSPIYLTRRFLAERLRYLDAIGFVASPTLLTELDRDEDDGLADGLVKAAHLLIAPTTKAAGESAAGRVSDANGLRQCIPPPARATPEMGKKTASKATRELPAVKHEGGRDTVRPESFANESTRSDQTSRRTSAEPERPRQVRIGAEHEPTRPLRYVVGYSDVFGPDAIAGQIRFQREISGDLQYSRDFFLFDELDRRLQLTVRAFSDFTADRRLAAMTVDERRTGGEIGAKLDLWRDLNGHWGQIDLRASWREIETDVDSRTAGRIEVSLVEAGLLYFRNWDGTPHSRRLQIEPSLRLGHADGRDAPYVRGIVDARHHQFVGLFNQWHVHGRALYAAGSTPDVELPSFGGEDTVRGYKPDAGLARTVWALQNEAWFPVRLGLGLPEDLDKLVRRRVAFAVFGDVGGLHNSRDDFEGVKAGVGIGLRLVWEDTLTLRIDYGHAVGDRSRTHAAGMLYFTVTTRPTL